MADQRQPNDNAVKTRTRTVNYRYEATGLTTDIGTTTYTSFRSLRPSYPKGAVITLPEGDTFRKSTNYTHQSWEVGSYGPASTGPGKSGIISPRPRWYSIDGGRDGSLFLAGNPVLVGVNYPQDAKNEAVTKALNKIADQKINLGENLATFNQTLGLFADKSKVLSTALHRIARDRSFRKFLNMSARDLSRAGITNTIAQNYLAYVYGLKPLMQDVYVAHELLKSQAKRTLLFKGVGKSQRSKAISKPQAGPAATNAEFTVVEWRSDLKVKCTLWARIDPNHQGLRSLNEFGLLNPLALAWELVPYSFVVDWFLPVGPVLYAMSAPAGLIFVDGSISCRNTEVKVFEYKVDRGSWSYKVVSPVIPAIVPITYEGYKRDIVTSWPTPGLWVDGDPFRGDRLFKAIALSILALNGTRPKHIR